MERTGSLAADRCTTPLTCSHRTAPSRRTILCSSGGLNSPVSLGYYPLDPAAYVINYAVPADLLVEQQPDWVVVLEVYGRRTFLQDARFLNQYRLWKTLPTDMYGSQGMLIFQRAAP